MDAFDRKAREIVDAVTAMVKRGDKREIIIEKLANAMRQATAVYEREQAMAPKPKQEGESDAA